MSDNNIANPGDPKLSHRMKVFIGVGTVIVFFALVAQFAFGDGFGRNEGFDPDTTLLPKQVQAPPAADSIAVDTMAADTVKTEKRHKSHSDAETSGTDAAAEGEHTEEVTLDNVGSSDDGQPQQAPIHQPAKHPKPHVEVLEN